MPSRRKRTSPDAVSLTWSEDTELIGLTLELQPLQDSSLYPQYTIGLHAWLLDQVRQADSDLSAYMHDGESEKPFTISGLQGLSSLSSRSHLLNANQTYHWTITALSQPVVQWVAQWLEHPPTQIDLRDAPLQIKTWKVSHVATHYNTLFESAGNSSTASPSITLSFLSPTSFRRKGHHFPLPVPRNVFHSYLRRWNDFSGQEFEPEYFLDWVEEYVVITRHHLQSAKVVAGKKGSVTGFTGSVEFSLSRPALEDAKFTQLFVALGQLAPYCGTGHKTTFGLGQTRLGWSSTALEITTPAVQDLLAQRIDQLTDLFKHQRKRIGGDRATHTAETWATILARRERGESLQDIAQDLEMPYETVKTYSKLARRALTALRA